MTEVITMKNNGNKHGLSKKGKLYLANIVFFIILMGSYLFQVIVMRTTIPDFFLYFIVQMIFTLVSLIVYFLSIIADAVSGIRVAQERRYRQYDNQRKQ